MHGPENEAELASAADRRKFLSACGKFAAVTPPAITLLLSTTLNSNAVSQSAGGDQGKNDKHPNNGGGNGPYDGSPNGKPDNKG